MMTSSGLDELEFIAVYYGVSNFLNRESRSSASVSYMDWGYSFRAGDLGVDVEYVDSEVTMYIRVWDSDNKLRLMAKTIFLNSSMRSINHLAIWEDRCSP